VGVDEEAVAYVDHRPGVAVSCQPFPFTAARLKAQMMPCPHRAPETTGGEQKVTGTGAGTADDLFLPYLAENRETRHVIGNPNRQVATDHQDAKFSGQGDQAVEKPPQPPCIATGARRRRRQTIKRPPTHRSDITQVSCKKLPSRLLRLGGSRPLKHVVPASDELVDSHKKKTAATYPQPRTIVAGRDHQVRRRRG